MATTTNGISTRAEAASKGELSTPSEPTRVLLRNEVYNSDIGCEMIASPSQTYASHQAVKYSDIKKSSSPEPPEPPGPSSNSSFYILMDGVDDENYTYDRVSVSDCDLYGYIGGPLDTFQCDQNEFILYRDMIENAQIVYNLGDVDNIRCYGQPYVFIVDGENFSKTRFNKLVIEWVDDNTSYNSATSKVLVSDLIASQNLSSYTYNEEDGCYVGVCSTQPYFQGFNTSLFSFRYYHNYNFNRAFVDRYFVHDSSESFVISINEKAEDLMIYNFNQALIAYENSIIEDIYQIRIIEFVDPSNAFDYVHLDYLYGVISDRKFIISPSTYPHITWVGNRIVESINNYSHYNLPDSYNTIGGLGFRVSAGEAPVGWHNALSVSNFWERFPDEQGILHYGQNAPDLLDENNDNITHELLFTYTFTGCYYLDKIYRDTLVDEYNGDMGLVISEISGNIANEFTGTEYEAFTYSINITTDPNIYFPATSAGEFYSILAPYNQSYISDMGPATSFDFIDYEMNFDFPYGAFGSNSNAYFSSNVNSAIFSGYDLNGSYASWYYNYNPAIDSVNGIWFPLIPGELAFRDNKYLYEQLVGSNQTLIDSNISLADLQIGSETMPEFRSLITGL